jgi:predicted ATPase
MDRFFVLTGGPGSGKSTLLAALGEAGFATMPEAGRSVIRRETAAGGSALPWADRAAFAERMLDIDMRSHAKAAAMDGIVLFDRGLPDVVGYLDLCRLPRPDRLMDAARRLRYNRTVFIAPPWPEIYARDTERKQDWDEAVATHDAMVRVYGEFGHTLIRLPLAPVADRAAFVREWVEALRKP